MLTIAEVVEHAAKNGKAGYRFMDDACEDSRYFTFQELERETARYAAAMQAMDLVKGDRVALILPDNVDFTFAFLGAARAGIIPVPIYPPPGLRKLEGYLQNTLHIVDKSGSKVVLTDTVVKQLLGSVQLAAPELRQVAAVEPVRTSQEPFRPERVSLDDTCFLQFTSGSTAAPKGVVLSHANLAANIHAIMDLGLKVRDGIDVGVSWLPLYHDMGLIGFMLAPLAHLCEITFIPPMAFLRRPARWLQQISERRGTISFGPNFAYALCVKRIKPREAAGLDLSCWRVAGCGAEPIRAENLLGFAEHFAGIGFDKKALMPCYGMAESTLAVSFVQTGTGVSVDTVDATRLAEGDAAPVLADHAGSTSVVSCGKAFEEHEIAVFEPDDDSSLRPLPDRQVGEIRLRGPSVSAGYFNDREISAAAFAGGWLRTGDLGYLVDGELFVCGRIKELIIVAGRNYYPQDLEWEATAVPGVRKGNVIAFASHGARDDRDRIVILFETAVIDGDKRRELTSAVRRTVQQATGLSVDDVVAVDAGVLPKTSSGKLKRFEAKHLFETGQLAEQTSIRKADPLGAARQIAKSQFSYLRYAIFGSAKKGGGS